ncbi:MAG: S-layer protein domain-containing protein [Methanosarcinaceae archaeon]|nr:S-layer protein domain-containing protein [Methanosarcinaceae archaeon]
MLTCFLLLGLLCTAASAKSSTGDRIWDGNNQSKDYTWNYLSYSGFYYDLDSGLGSEEMEIKDIKDRSIGEGDLIYTTKPIDTDFEFSKWNSYQVIGFMAEKYFAGYSGKNTTFVDKDVSLIKEGVLSKVLIDSDDKKSVSTGAALVLEEGYSLCIAEVDVNGENVWIQLKKDGKVISDGFVRGNQDYIYEKDLGDAEDVPVIIVRFGSVFAGSESTATFIEGIFQISDECIEIENGQTFGKMKISSVTSSKIEMENEDDISLKNGATVDIMGKLKIRVADDNDLRFAPFVDMSEAGIYELRGTVYDKDAENPVLKWTPLNFEGFYYNIDEGIGTEELTIEDLKGSKIPKRELVYSTKPQEVEFECSKWDNFQVIGFMAEKYFAGYSGETTSDDITSKDISLLSDNTLSKVLIDNDDKMSVYTGSSLELEDGYSIKIQEVDVKGEKIWVQLEKDGKVVDDGFLSSKDTYIYKTDIGEAEDIPVILVYFESVFAGSETNAVFVNGIFQISEKGVQIEDGESFGEMEVSEVSKSGIEMKNEEDISLSEGDDISIMNNIKFRVADPDNGNDLRFYPFVEIDTKGSEDSARKLEINVPAGIYLDSSFKIKVTAEDGSVEDVTLKLDGELIGNTNADGILSFTPETRGTFKLSAEKEDYSGASKSIEVLDPKESLSISVSPNEVYEGDTVSIEVVKAIGGEPVEGAEVTLDGDSIGRTGTDGKLSSTLTKTGNVQISATGDGFESKSISLHVGALEAKFVFSELVINPTEAKTGKDATISVKATNTGNAAGEYNAELLVNGNVKDSRTISLEPSENKTIEFTHAEAEEGSYKVQVGDQTASYEVVKSLPFIGAPLSLAVLLVAFVLLRKKD